MTTSIAGHKGDEPVATFRLIPSRKGLIVIWALLIAVTFNLINLYPDVAVTGLIGNDEGMHLLATDLAVQSIIQRQDFTDPWQSAIGMGHPLFHYYQHLPHISVALVHVLTFGVFPVADMVNWASYLLLCLFRYPSTGPCAFSVSIDCPPLWAALLHHSRQPTAFLDLILEATSIGGFTLNFGRWCSYPQP